MTNHLRDTPRNFQDDRKTRNALTNLKKPANGASRTPKSIPRGAPGASRSTVGDDLGRPKVPRRATQAPKSISLEREHTSSRPAGGVGPPGLTQPPRYIELSTATLSYTISPSGPARHPPTPDPRGRRILLGCAHCRRPRKEDLCSQRQREARADSIHKYPDKR